LEALEKGQTGGFERPYHQLRRRKLFFFIPSRL
jgi:hypothetical protein